MRQNSSPRLVLDLEKLGSKVSSLKWLRKRPKFRGIPRLVLEKAEEKGKIPRLVSSSTSEKFYQRSRPRPRPRQMTPREPLKFLNSESDNVCKIVRLSLWWLMCVPQFSRYQYTAHPGKDITILLTRDLPSECLGLNYVYSMGQARIKKSST